MAEKGVRCSVLGGSSSEFNDYDGGRHDSAELLLHCNFSNNFRVSLQRTFEDGKESLGLG
ncbi:hypothetical protein C5167_047910 [Papaver somniferum]|uniref:Uncharacterized protein n=1 Tax=Papaver somniferum TaxID=3469 RepID=A0A4Y7KJR7_PAPSO|nr:hypothetical protein C5167_047910 [Papaver somniferum]